MSAFHGAGGARVWHGSVACLLDQPEPGQDKSSIGSKDVTESVYN